MAGIYLHIPFCRQACHYCDFHFSTNTSVLAALIASMVQEVNLQRQYLDGESVATIYFGGGTPTLLTEQQTGLLLQAIRNNFNVRADAEVTLEANPDDLTVAKLRELKAAGVNRLSIGIQSFQDDVLKFLNRAHDAEQAKNCVALARHIGFDNISIDLIYAIPGQSEEAWRENIKTAISLEPEHISSYSLTVEKQTVFGKWAAKGKFLAVEDDVAAHQLEILVDELERAGFDQYEVSNFSRPGWESRHNSSYWKQEKYLGVGPSAHSYNRVTRQFNIRNNHVYIRSIQEGKIPFELEHLSVEDHVNEYLLTTLRTRWGVNLENLKQQYAYDLLNSHPQFIDELFRRKLAVIENGFLRLTKPGKLLADKISSELFLVS
jgi:oxygen-independent coproporphyrinogen III oxidase